MYLAIRNRKGQVVEAVGWPKRRSLGEVATRRIPPKWKNVRVDPTPGAKVVAIGYDEKGREQRLYSLEHTLSAKDTKFQRVRKLIARRDFVEAEIELDIKNRLRTEWREAAIVAYLILETGIRPGSNADTKGDYTAYGATTLLMTHVKVMQSGRVWLKFRGKKGVDQKVLVTNPWLVEELRRRKRSTTSWTAKVFNCSASRLNLYFQQLGDGEFSAKDLRTMKGTMMADELLGKRRVPQQVTKRKKIVRTAIREVAAALGNTPAVAKASYVDPKVLERWLPL
jgi:DNA topoisomerase-1